MAEESYTLPKTDPCYRDFEAIKSFAKPRIEALEHNQTYQQFRPLLEKAQACCPELRGQIQDLRPERPDEKPQSDFTLPADFFHNFAVCSKIIFPNKELQAAVPLGEAWIQEYEGGRSDFWVAKYLALATDLQGCCAQKVASLQAQLAAAPAPSSEWIKRSHCDQGTREMAENFANEYQKMLQQAKTDRETQVKAAAVREGKLHDDLVAASQRLESWKIATARVTEERDRLRAELTAAAPRPGAGLFAAFPSGEGSTALALCGTAVLLTGFLLGLSSRHAWWAKLASGTVAALISFCVYLAAVYMLPDTRPTDLLLAVTGGLLFASLGALLHLHLSPVRRQGQALNRFSQWRPPRERQAAPAIPEPGRRTRWRPSPAGQPVPAPPAAAPQAPRESDDETRRRGRRTANDDERSSSVVDGYTLLPFDEGDRQQRIFRCQGCGRLYREASLQQMFQRTGRSCYGCGSTDFREHQLPP